MMAIQEANLCNARTQLGWRNKLRPLRVEVYSDLMNWKAILTMMDIGAMHNCLAKGIVKELSIDARQNYNRIKTVKAKAQLMLGIASDM